MIELAAGDWQCGLRADLGAATVLLRYRGRDVLRPCPATIDSPLDAGNFPLVPYANRIAEGRFSFDGADYHLPANFGDHPHTLHGVGWQAPWEVVEQSANAALLRHDHATGASWPWHYQAQQQVTVGTDGVRFDLTVRNLGDRPMPAGLGFHPYFPRSPGASIRATLGNAWLANDTMLPTEQVSADHFDYWQAGAPVERDTLVDHCHGGWNGTAEITTNGMTIRITGEGTSWLHLYLPPGADFFCVEPVSHLPNAINRRDPAALGLVMLQPGESTQAAMELSIV